MNKRIKKKRAKLNPMPCAFCGSKIKAEPWGIWWQVGCCKYYCNNPFFMLAKKKKYAIQGWNKQMKIMKGKEK